MDDHIAAAFAELGEFFDLHRQDYNLSFGLQYSSVIDWVADITPRRGHPKAREYPLWQACATTPAEAIWRSIQLAKSAIADHKDGGGQLE